MTTQIDVVDINDNINDNTNVPPSSEVKPKAKAKPRAKAKANIQEIPAPAEIKEELPAPVEEIKEELPPPAEEIKEELPAKSRNRPELKEKVNCPDCGKEVTVHGLKYTHRRYCKSIQPEPTKQVARGPEQQPQPTLTTEPFVPTDEQLATYLQTQKRMRADKKREHMSSLVSNALPN